MTYRCGVGKLIWTVTTTRPDLTFASVKLSQANSAPDEHHDHGVKHVLKYLYSTRVDGIYYWRKSPCLEFPERPLPTINSNKQDLILDNCPQQETNTLNAYAELDWATFVKTRHSFGGTVIQLTDGTITYKSKFQPTAAGSSTKAKFMAA